MEAELWSKHRRPPVHNCSNAPRIAEEGGGRREKEEEEEEELF